ncbi:hypothetical protein [Paenibacillus tianmuensis]|uniref:hypothetical protein n=1 Tax=Paenibacillus tianmuensis TaxID=624147 RepID=UPI00115F9B46|nr:hypothetical protein [Paenibacillus tianmuensis]
MDKLEKIEIGFTQFIDFTIKQGQAKLSHVRQVKNQEDYHPAKDFWKAYRDGVREMHENGYSYDYLDRIAASAHIRKKSHYVEAVKQYKKYFKNRQVEWFDPGKSFWTFGDLAVRSTPELGLIIDGKKHLVKIYLKENDDRFDRWTINSALALMANSTRSKVDGDDVTFSVFHVKKAKRFDKQDLNEDDLIILEGEAAHFVELWRRI